MELVKLLPCIDIVLIFFHVLILQEYWALMESRMPLKLVLWDVRIVALSIGLIKPSLLFSNIVGSLYCIWIEQGSFLRS